MKMKYPWWFLYYYFSILLLFIALALASSFGSVALIVVVAYWMTPPLFLLLRYAERHHEQKQMASRREEAEKLLRVLRRGHGTIVFGKLHKVRVSLAHDGVIMGSNRTPYVEVRMSYLGKEATANVVSTRHLDKEVRDFAEVLLADRMIEREKNDEAEKLLQRLKRGESVSVTERNESRGTKTEKKQRLRKDFLTSKDKLEEAKKALANSMYAPALASTCSSFEEWLREVLDIDDTIQHINPHNIVEQWKTNKLPHWDEVGKMAETLSLTVPTKHPPLRNPTPQECVRHIKRMENLIKLQIKVSDHEKQIIKSNLHIA